MEFKANVCLWIEVQRQREKNGKLGRNMIGLSGNKNVRLLINSNAQESRGIKRTQTMKVIGSKPKKRKSTIVKDASYVGINV